ncbi:RNA-binding S4 domain-containing protein [Corynebacterium diphtheriae]|uniref:RNA-binding protein S4 n=1 Tax=Corynebacterium diphtheriae bv. mitis TaxID=1806053 RepID=A0A854NCY0_CORDP|nr:RNA-binding S4 domain-containing protein [Corynebacterium diphtheriae]OWM33974.1 RNA-binding protein S4 [Corynebacterium diphtheriae bv. mitis]OWM54915.1 RNA-binding protein S4 [Corynebacterium diphtheriae]OWM95314.1 RNA-binding protein S4 [Corynebacterium diphtheriae bv. gravis]OWN00818.1 RNA-binding protein S4 [Corynebacterium diphtheriae bv. gravis]OWN10395.1 RNA-binding protein S4 [Corynebacterium diphtheriae bv. gravis]
MAEDAAPVRIDVWVWAVRLLKTRSLSAQACKAGHIKLNGVAVKPSQLVTPGDRVRVWADHRERDVEVVSTVRKRVGAAIAQACYIDHSPPPPPKEILLSMPRRDKGAGRPTKKERRDIDRLCGRR